ncbi:hypothetical protein PVAG01_06169 [Phlyctema vagabunda]|uniref:Uncharacterized protein n=1 Tax=Phlyctema vagabunda TaxID=108571 RepID=A0ABR4PFA7_9HELO
METPKWQGTSNNKQLFLRSFLVLGSICTFFIVIFNQQIASSLATFRESLSSCPARNNTPTIFQEEKSYQTFDSSADNLWRDLVTPNGGFFFDETRTDSKVYGIAMFHQLHCVQMFRQDFQELYARLDGRSDGKLNVLHHIDEKHLLHCLDYLRQVFLCYADGSIEPTMEDPESGIPKTDGMVPHYCNNPAIWYEQSLASHKRIGKGSKAQDNSGMHGH